MQRLSHYTSFEGLVGIVRSQALWATEFRSLNDRSEFTYAIGSVFDEAFSTTLTKIPEDLRSKLNPEERQRLLVSYADAIRQQVSIGDGYDSLYVTSFARGRTEDEDERGVLTLWDRYTRNKGYCLQFQKQNIKRIVDHEMQRHSYSWLELCEVRYGVDKQSSDYLNLVTQMSLRMRIELLRRTKDLRLDLLPSETLDADSYFLRKLTSFCGKHKDPAFSDEREVRVFACPAPKSESRPFIGIALRKQIYRRADGVRYIVIGESVLPGLIPETIIKGPKAELDFWLFSALYPAVPKIRECSIPIR